MSTSNFWCSAGKKSQKNWAVILLDWFSEKGEKNQRETDSTCGVHVCSRWGREQYSSGTRT